MVQDGLVRWQLSVIPVWVVVAIGALLIGLLSPPQHYLTWLPIALAGGTFITFCVQLALVQKEGLVDRVMASLGGSVIILVIATAILAPLA
ncbi:MAG: hypothetical protein JWM70_2001 [Microbacteriaceae bacterium]|nr:hypothetical protein [Microbacteriaceae bacterium]